MRTNGEPACPIPFAVTPAAAAPAHSGATVGVQAARAQDAGRQESFGRAHMKLGEATLLALAVQSTKLGELAHLEPNLEGFHIATSRHAGVVGYVEIEYRSWPAVLVFGTFQAESKAARLSCRNWTSS